MFRHPTSNYQSAPKDGFLENISIDQFIRYYRVPSVQDKQDVLNLVQSKIPALPDKKGAKVINARLFFTIGSIAAVACFLLFFLYFSYFMQTFSNSQHEEAVCFLPDHSRVIVAPGAEISYPKVFFFRTVKLNGSAYFEVEKGSKFKVKTDYGEITVLGTRFSVVENNGSLQVCCYEGAVKVKCGGEERQLQIGQWIESSNQEIGVSQRLDERYPEMAYFKRKYNNANLSKISADLKNFFGIDIIISAPNTSHFSGTFHAPDIESVLEILCTPFDLNYTKRPDGSYEIFSQKTI
jgi:transmembrane sensor